MTTTVIIEKAQDHLDVKVKFKNPKTGEVFNEQIITENVPIRLCIFDSQSLEIEEIRK